MDETVKSIISAAIKGETLDVKTHVEKAIGERVAQQLEMKKIDIARNLIGHAPNMVLQPQDEAISISRDTNAPCIVHHSPWDKGVKKRNTFKKEELEALLQFVKDEYEVDVEDTEELELILEDLDEEDLEALMEDFVEQPGLDEGIVNKIKAVFNPDRKINPGRYTYPATSVLHPSGRKGTIKGPSKGYRSEPKNYGGYPG